MQKITWSDAMSVGVPALDADHRCLVRIISLLQDAEGDEAQRIVKIVLETLSVYCRYHFAREEQVMAGCGFPAIAFHRGEHERFTSMISKLREQREPCDAYVSAHELLDYLITWLRHHILIQDMAYRPYVRDSEAANQLAQDTPVTLPEPRIAVVDEGIG
jgi:hemerythrin-like metal-binding protein